MAIVSIVRTLNITCVQGDTFALPLSFYEDCANTIPTDMAGKSFYAIVRDGQTSSDTLILEFLDSDFTLRSGTTNVIDMSKSALDMVVDYGDFFYDLQISDVDSGVSATILRGKFTIQPQITNV